MPATERLVAITEYLGSHRPFRAVVKQSAEDFIVKEVMQNGHIAEVTKLPQIRNKRPERDESQTTEPSSIPTPTDEQFTELDALLPAPGEKLPSQIIRDFFQLETTRKSCALLPPCESKALRTDVHAWVRKCLPGCISDTIETPGGQLIRLRLTSAVRPSKRRRSDRAGESVHTPATGANDLSYVPRGTPVQFILWKRDRDTNDAINALAKVLHVRPSTFSYAGTKDKRAVTMQLVQVKNMNENRFVHANRKLFRPTRPNILISDIAIGNRDGLHLGDLLGNRFTLVLRDVDIAGADDERNIRSAAESVKTFGFVNYFGLQRFGSGVSPTHETGFALLRGDYEDVCRRLLLPLRFGENGEVDVRPERLEMVKALDEFAAGKVSAKDLLAKLPERMLVERTIARQLANDEDRGIVKYDYKAALSKLPRNLRRMYGHAVQSYLFNVMASERIRYYSPNHESKMHAIEGDLVFVKDTDEKDVNYLSEVRAVTKEEEESKSISIYRVVIPVVGSEVDVPDNKCGEVVAKLLKEEKVNLKAPLSVEVGMKGTYRKLLARPTDVELEFVSYAHKYERLVSLGIEKLDFGEGHKRDDNTPKEGLTEAKPAKVEVNGQVDSEKESGGGTTDGPKCDSKTSVSEKQDVEPVKCEKESGGGTTDGPTCDSKTSAGEKQDVEPVECEKESGGCTTDGPTCDSKTSAGEKQDVEPVNGHSLGDTKTAKADTEEKTRRALILSFTLGCAEYATMMIRELTKSDSSAANQRALQEDANVKK